MPSPLVEPFDSVVCVLDARDKILMPVSITHANAIASVSKFYLPPLTVSVSMSSDSQEFLLCYV